MKIFESFKEYQLNESLGDTYIKRKSLLTKYEGDGPLLVKQQMVTVSDSTVESFFNNDEEMSNSDLLKFLRYFEFYYDLFLLDKESAKVLQKAAKEALDKVSATRYPSNDFISYFEDLKRILKQNTSATYRNTLLATHKWYYENFNSVPALKELSLKTNITCDQLGAIFDIKYIYVLSSLATKLSTNQIELQRF